MHRLGIEPGPPAWQASILPLNHRCLHEFNGKIKKRCRTLICRTSIFISFWTVSPKGENTFAFEKPLIFISGAVSLFWSGLRVVPKSEVFLSGNWTPVSRVTGGDTHHYTNKNDWLLLQTIMYISRRDCPGNQARMSHLIFVSTFPHLITYTKTLYKIYFGHMVHLSW